jgi:hypothetical protein
LPQQVRRGPVTPQSPVTSYHLWGYPPVPLLVYPFWFTPFGLPLLVYPFWFTPVPLLGAGKGGRKGGDRATPSPPEGFPPSPPFGSRKGEQERGAGKGKPFGEQERGAGVLEGVGRGWLGVLEGVGRGWLGVLEGVQVCWKGLFRCVMTFTFFMIF